MFRPSSVRPPSHLPTSFTTDFARRTVLIAPDLQLSPGRAYSHPLLRFGSHLARIPPSTNPRSPAGPTSHVCAPLTHPASPAPPLSISPTLTPFSRCSTWPAALPTTPHPRCCWGEDTSASAWTCESWGQAPIPTTCHPRVTPAHSVYRTGGRCALGPPPLILAHVPSQVGVGRLFIRHAVRLPAV
jgi:hypothetical protein